MLTEWRDWNQNLQSISQYPQNFVAENNLYDPKYIEYFAGIKPVVLPSWKPMESSYMGTSTEIFVAPVHAHDSVIWGKSRTYLLGSGN